MNESLIAPWVPKIHYTYEKSHSLIGSAGLDGHASNIGSRGQNLTICFLSMDRVHLSMRLLDSINEQIPGFSGKILIADNGSSEESLAQLREYLANTSFAYDLVEFGENHGVAGGRNRASEFISTDWFMSLDNDIYFIGNPIPAVHEELCVTGAHFINLPLLNSDKESVFSSGGHLFVGINGEPTIGGGGTNIPNSQVPIENLGEFGLGTFLFGGASILNLKSFKRLGKFDENYFVGFEDTDFSISIFKAGMKIANSSAHFLVHAHEIPESQIDINYEKTRFSHEHILNSGKYFELKHGFKAINSETIDWIETRWKDLQLGSLQLAIESEESGKPQVDNFKQKPKIALVIDVSNWAFANIASQISLRLSDIFDFVIIPAANLDNLYSIWLLSEDCDLIHFFWGNHILQTLKWTESAEASLLGLSTKEFLSRFVKNKKITIGVYDHLHLSEEEISQRGDLFNSFLSGYSVSSNILFEIYSSISKYPAPTAVIHDGVDLSLFNYDSHKFQDIEKRPIRLGWVGNSKWASEISDFKGFSTILEPAVSELKANGLFFDFMPADRQIKFIPHSQMPDYYSKIDVLVCVSEIEGTPNPILEAMASGCAVVSTNVGIVPEVFGEKQKKYILKNRNVSDLVSLITKLIDNPSEIVQLSAENLQIIRSWDWKLKVKNFEVFFNTILNDDEAAKKLSN